MDPQNPFLTPGNAGAEHEDSQEVLAEQAMADAGQSQAMYNYNQKLLEQKERELMESIALNYGRIREVERELGNLQLQLKLTSGPKKHALELLRKKIETQNERVAYVRSKHTAAKAAYERLDAELKQEEAAKDQLCGELNTLVQQAAKAQLDKLEELKATLEGLNTGVLPTHKNPQQQQQQQKQPPMPTSGPAAAGRTASQQQGNEEAGPSGAAASQQIASAAAIRVNGSAVDEEQESLRLRQEQEREEQERRKCEAEAAVARSRHVSLGSASGGAGSGLLGERPNGAPAAASVATAGPTGHQAGSGSPGRTAARSGSKAGPGAATAATGATPAARPKAQNGGAMATVQPKQRFAGFDT